MICTMSKPDFMREYSMHAISTQSIMKDALILSSVRSGAGWNLSWKQFSTRTIGGAGGLMDEEEDGSGEEEGDGGEKPRC